MSTVIEWFEKIENKNTCKFTKIDTIEFCPSIMKKLPEKSIILHETSLKQQVINIFKHTKQSLPFHGHKAWAKEEEKNVFDVTMGSYDGEEVCNLVRIYFLSKRTLLIGTKNVRLICDDGLVATHPSYGPKMNRISK